MLPAAAKSMDGVFAEENLLISYHFINI